MECSAVWWNVNEFGGRVTPARQNRVAKRIAGRRRLIDGKPVAQNRACTEPGRAALITTEESNNERAEHSSIAVWSGA